MEYLIFFAVIILIFTCDDAWKRHDESKIRLEAEKQKTIKAETELVQARTAEAKALSDLSFSPSRDTIQ